MVKLHGQFVRASEEATRIGGGGLPIRRVWFKLSVTYTLPAVSTATPRGLLNCATLPGPSLLPAYKGEPAMVVTTPAGVIFRMVWLKESATYTLAAVSTASPYGELNRATGLVPSLF